MLKAVNDYFGCREELAEILKANIGSVMECQGQQKILKIKERLRELNCRRNDLVMMIANGACSEDILDTEFEKIYAEEQELTEQLEQLQEKSKTSAETQQKIDDAMQDIAKEKFQLEVFDNIIIRKVLECVKVISKDELLVIFKGGVEMKVTIEN